MDYILHSSILIAGFVLFYWLLLREETFYQLNRWIILSSIILSLTLPLIQVPASFSLRSSGPTSERVTSLPLAQLAKKDTPKAINPIEIPAEKEIPTEVTVSSSLSWQQILTYLYLIGVGIFALVFCLQLIVLLARRYTLNSVKAGKYQIVELVKEQEPYSFLNSIFINPSSYDEDTYAHIFEHEKIHVDQNHFLDKLLAEFLVVIFWFNPFVWILRSALSKNLEFLTDESLLKKGLPKEAYQMSLLKVSTSTKPFNLTNSYNNSFLKNRIMMMNTKKSSLTSSWKYLFILPLFLLSMMSLNAVSDHNYQSNDATTETILDQQPSEQEPITKTTEAKKPVDKKAKTVPPKRNVDDGNGAHVSTGSASKKLDYPSNTLPITVDNSFKSIELDLPPISGVGTSSIVNLSISQGSKQSVRIEGSTHLVDHINKEVEDGFWNIGFDKNFDKGRHEGLNLNVFLTVVSLDKLVASGASNVSGNGKFTSDKQMEIHCSGAGNIHIDVTAPLMHCAISGAGNINLLGSTGMMDARVSGAGNIYAPTFVVESADVRISGAGKFVATVQSSLNAEISGTGSVSYQGNPSVTKKISGAGSVKRL